MTCHNRRPLRPRHTRRFPTLRSSAACCRFAFLWPQATPGHTDPAATRRSHSPPPAAFISQRGGRASGSFSRTLFFLLSLASPPPPLLLLCCSFARVCASPRAQTALCAPGPRSAHAAATDPRHCRRAVLPRRSSLLARCFDITNGGSRRRSLQSLTRLLERLQGLQGRHRSPCPRPQDAGRS